MEPSSGKEPALSFRKRILDVYRKLGWSFLSVVVALIFGGVVIYCEFIRYIHPQLRYDILTNTSVLDVKEELGALSVLFDGIDIREKGLSLRVITIRVLNNSSVDILKGYYDDKAPLGLIISKGKIIKHEPLSASSEYLKDNLELKTEGDNVLHFPNLIIEARESFTIKLLVLHSRDDLPTLKPIGKVAGIKTVRVLEPYKDEGKESFLSQAFRGGFLIQLTKIVSYAIATILLLVCIIVPIVVVVRFRGKRKRKKVTKDFKSETTLKLGQSDEGIFECYLKNDAWNIKYLQSRITLFEKSFKKDEMTSMLKETGGESNFVILDKSKLENYNVWYVDEMNNFLKLRLLKRTEYGLAIDSNLMHTLKHFESFLRDRGLIKIYKEEEEDKELNDAQKKFLDSI